MRSVWTQTERYLKLFVLIFGFKNGSKVFVYSGNENTKNGYKRDYCCDNCRSNGCNGSVVVIIIETTRQRTRISITILPPDRRIPVSSVGVSAGVGRAVRVAIPDHFDRVNVTVTVVVTVVQRFGQSGHSVQLVQQVVVVGQNTERTDCRHIFFGFLYDSSLLNE